MGVGGGGGWGEAGTNFLGGIFNRGSFIGVGGAVFGGWGEGQFSGGSNFPGSGGGGGACFFLEPLFKIILDDDNRVVLNNITSKEDTDYINASYINVSISNLLFYSAIRTVGRMIYPDNFPKYNINLSRPRWLSWTRRRLETRRCGFNSRRGRQHSFVEIDHEIFSRSFSPFRWFKKGSCQFLAKECAQYWLIA